MTATQNDKISAAADSAKHNIELEIIALYRDLNKVAGLSDEKLDCFFMAAVLDITKGTIQKAEDLIKFGIPGFIDQKDL